MKLLSFAVPCYNSQDYMEKCIDSLLVGGEDVEILIVDDGSSDRTAEIADSYEDRFPGIVRAIHKPNGGHGSAINTGLAAAEGVFFKVVDSDDWVSREAYVKILRTLKDLISKGQPLDMMVSNFVYEKVDAGSKVMRYRHALPENRVFTWDEVGIFFKGQYILMHSVIFRTELLRSAGIVMPEHTFYVDNLFVFEPLPSVKYLYYLNVNFYRYYIGRADQSVNEKVMIGRIDQQMKVNRIMVDFLCEHKFEIKTRRKLWHYMMNYLEIITTISVVMALRSGSEENLAKRKELWEYIREQDMEIFIKLRYGLMGGYMNLPGKAGRKISLAGYRLSQKLFKFN